jgi:hypothetical protein
MLLESIAFHALPFSVGTSFTIKKSVGTSEVIKHVKVIFLLMLPEWGSKHFMTISEITWLKTPTHQNSKLSL